MAKTNYDVRRVAVEVTNDEMATFLGERAQQSGIIDFAPTKVDVVDNGDDGFIITFDNDLTKVTPA